MEKKLLKFWFPKSDIPILFLIILLTFFLRIYGINFGLPYLYNPDEPTFVSRAMHFGTGDLNPHWFGHPGSTLMYILFLLYGVYFVLGHLLGIFPDWQSFETLFQTDPTTFYLIGRTTTVLFGTLTVFLVYLIAKKIYNKKVGLVAALFLSVSYLHSVHSQLIRTDITTTFFVVLSVLFSLFIYERKELKYYILAGLTAGIAIATKYTSGVAIFPIIAAHLLAEGKKIYQNRHRLWDRNLFFLCLLIIGTAIIVGSYFANVARISVFAAKYFSPDGKLEESSLLLLRHFRISMGIFGFFIIVLTLLSKFIKPFGNLILNLMVDKKFLLGLSFVLIGFFIFAPFFFTDFRRAHRDLVREARPSALGANRLSGINNHLWYITNALNTGLGIQIEILAGLGILWTLFKGKKRELLLLCFPLIYFLAIGLGRLRWARWIIPVIPFMAIFAGMFLQKIIDALPKANFLQRNKDFLLAIIAILLTINLTYKIICHDYLISHKDTRTYCKEWVENNIPGGSKIAQEKYTCQIWKPGLPSRWDFSNTLFDITRKFSLSEKPFEYYMEEGFDYLLVSSFQYDRYFAESAKYPKNVNFYNMLFKKGELIQEFRPNPKNKPGPTIKIYKISLE